MKKIILSIEGMTCSACSNGLEKYLNKQNDQNEYLLITSKRYYDEYKGLYEIHQYMMAQRFRQLPRLWVRQVRGDLAYIRQQPIGKKTKIKWAIYSAFRNFDRFVGGTLGGKYHTYSEAKQKFLDKHISQQYKQRKA